MKPVMTVVLAAAIGIGAASLSATGGSGRRDSETPIAVPLLEASLASSPSEAVAVFAGGCFWGIEGVFEHLKGVKNAVSGYAGGMLTSPSYETVSSGETGHAESVRVTYDPSKISYAKLLEVFFFVVHDATQLNRQGPDVGTQYRSVVFYVNDEQKRAAESYIAQLTGTKTYSRPIVTEVTPLAKFYEAEAYHQDYMVHHPDQPYIVYNDAPKVEHLKKAFPEWYVEGSRK